MQAMTTLYDAWASRTVPSPPSTPRLLPQPGWPADLRIRTIGRDEHVILVSFSLGPLTGLTRAELEVARLANAGHANAVIALHRITIGARNHCRADRLVADGLGEWRAPGAPMDSLLSATGPEVEQRRVTRISREIASGDWATLAGVDAHGMRHATMIRDSAKPVDWLVLSRLHWDVLALVAGGFAQKVIAMKLGLAPSTVSLALATARRRLGLGSLGQLVRAYCAALDPADRSAGRALGP
jgi:DNA-binding CsgD family transcriptional regulator